MHPSRACLWTGSCCANKATNGCVTGIQRSVGEENRWSTPSWLSDSEIRFRWQVRISFINRNTVEIKSLGSNILFVGPLQGPERNSRLLQIVEDFHFCENAAIQVRANIKTLQKSLTELYIEPKIYVGSD